VFKTFRAGGNDQAIVIATGIRGDKGWEVQTVTGRRLTGTGLSLIPRGLLVARDASAFRYTPGKGIQNIAVPEEYHLAHFQHGNVGSTGFVLLERNQTATGGGSVSDLWNATKKLGSAFGIGNDGVDDYALMNMDSGKLYPLNIAADGKKVATQYSECQRKNAWLNECKKFESVESLYDVDGTRNDSHYYWRAIWLQTKQGPIAVTKENWSKDIFITDLNSGKRVVAFHRTLGVGYFDVAQRSDGSVGITAKLAFDTNQIPDAAAYLKDTAPATVEPTSEAAQR
jgi:hypothetical protein